LASADDKNSFWVVFREEFRDCLDPCIGLIDVNQVKPATIRSIGIDEALHI
jgi:hypothetical protein